MSKKFSGGHIEASQEVYDALLANGNKDMMYAELLHNCVWIAINANHEILQYNSFEKHINDYPRRFYINNGELSWEKPVRIKRICDNPDVNSANQLDATTSLDDLDMSIGEEGIKKLAEAISKDPTLIFAGKVYEITNALAEMLIDKNAKYGNSALEPKRIFSSSDAIEQINVRIDDKLSRIANQNENDDEDAELDLMGYLILKRIAKKMAI